VVFTPSVVIEIVGCGLWSHQGSHRDAGLLGIVRFVLSKVNSYLL
jgi:hypothetical protein